MITISQLLRREIQSVKGVGEKRLKQLNKMGIHVLEDMLYYFPRNYEDRTKIKKISECIDGERICVKAMPISKVTSKRIRRGLNIYKVLLRDDTGTMTATWFNQKYTMSGLEIGQIYIFYGKVSIKYGKIEIGNPIFEKMGKQPKYMQKIVPNYPLSSTLTQKFIQTIVKNCLDIVGDSVKEYLPSWIRKKYNLSGINCAIRNIHFPNDFEAFQNARKRLVFEELFLLQMGLFKLRNEGQQLEGLKYKDVSDIEQFIIQLPFQLTKAQNKVFEEIKKDLQSGNAMHRLVQGDVGSGKTVIAVLAMYMSVKNGYQAALMVPTEILAKQHYKSFIELFKNDEEIKICLLTGSTSKKNKEIRLTDINQGKVDIVIGTHALIQEGIAFDNLGLVVTDEQHRFGVNQRTTLSQKGDNPHILVMTATPIPRTLALILYGDLDISIIDELPPGRKEVKTYSVEDDMRVRIYAFLKKQIDEGRQVYIVCPLIEESEVLDVKSAVEFLESLQNTVLRECSIALLHGKMKQTKKEEIMKQYINGDIDVLVSTTVIEVGVNIPNASVMVIESAERFGLSQLHQLRGRVGRGEYQSYCILFNNSKSKIAIERMKIMQQTNDGFKISEKDLELRGPGEFFGTRQHGIPDLKIANLFRDMELLKLAQQAANELIEQDATLHEEEHGMLKEKLRKKMQFANM